MRDTNLYEYYDPNAAYVDCEPPRSRLELIYWFFYGLWCGLTKRAADFCHTLSGKHVHEDDIQF